MPGELTRDYKKEREHLKKTLVTAMGLFIKDDANDRIYREQLSERILNAIQRLEESYQSEIGDIYGR